MLICAVGLGVNTNCSPCPCQRLRWRSLPAPPASPPFARAPADRASPRQAVACLGPIMPTLANSGFRTNLERRPSSRAPASPASTIRPLHRLVVGPAALACMVGPVVHSLDGSYFVLQQQVTGSVSRRCRCSSPDWQWLRRTVPDPVRAQASSV